MSERCAMKWTGSLFRSEYHHCMHDDRHSGPHECECGHYLPLDDGLFPDHDIARNDFTYETR